MLVVVGPRLPSPACTRTANHDHDTLLSDDLARAAGVALHTYIHALAVCFDTKAVGVGLALYTLAIACFSGFLGPVLTGALVTVMHSFAQATLLNGACIIAAGLLMAGLAVWERRQARRQQQQLEAATAAGAGVGQHAHAATAAVMGAGPADAAADAELGMGSDTHTPSAGGDGSGTRKLSSRKGQSNGITVGR